MLHRLEDLATCGTLALRLVSSPRLSSMHRKTTARPVQIAFLMLYISVLLTLVETKFVPNFTAFLARFKGLHRNSSSKFDPFPSQTQTRVQQICCVHNLSIHEKMRWLALSTLNKWDLATSRSYLAEPSHFVISSL